MKFMFSYLKHFRWLTVACVSFKVLATVLELLLPYVLEYMIDEVAPTRSVRMILFWGAGMLILAVAVRFLNVTANRFSVKSARGAAYEMRRDLFRHSLNLSGEQMDAFGLPSLTSRMTADSYNVQSFLQSVQAMGIRAPIMLLGGIIVTLTMDVGLALILCVLTPLMLAVAIGVSVKGIPLYDRVQQGVDELVRIMRENISGVRVIRALSRTEYERDRFAKANSTMAKREQLAGVIMSLPSPVITMALNLGLTLVVIIGAFRVNNGVTKPGVILAFLTYFNMIMMGVMSLNRLFTLMSKASASARRIETVIAQPEGLPMLPETGCAHAKSDAFIVFEGVSFRYGAPSADHPDMQMSLHNLSFELSRGSSLGIIGATGAGKTTVLNLLMRFYDPTEGYIFVDGRDVRSYEKEQLHRKFGVVFQNDVIFAQTLEENINFGRNVSEENIRNAVKNAQAEDFIEAYSDNYQHRVAIHGADLSGGQQQRVLIARALAAEPEILILDDASSALDYRTAAALRRVLREQYCDTTLIVVSQRVSSVLNLDSILVLDNGELIGFGTHRELLETCPAYRGIFETQMGEWQEVN